jgi:2-keto-4-pentenoate hydratase/2-oxohepta-3-ene-1,7-dioic acid hydratase in catechol pathway
MSLTALQASAYLRHLHFTTPQPERIIAYLTAFTRLSPGGCHRNRYYRGSRIQARAQVFMKDGDRVEVTIDGFGTLVSTIEQEPEPDSNHHVGN